MEIIPFLDLHKVNARFEIMFQERFKSFLASGNYILGEEVKTFEQAFAQYCGTKHCVAVSNGLDALTLIFKAYIQLGKLKENEEVLVPANTYIASILAVINAGLTPVFVEPDAETYNLSITDLEAKISTSTKAVLVVHLYGQLAEMNAINQLAKRKGLLVIEDAAQAHGAKNSEGLRAGNLADAAGFSFYPTKNLGAMGDAGGITTNDDDLADRLKLLRNYGSSTKYQNTTIGFNCRMDELQAAFLNVKLPYLDSDNKARQNIANIYLNQITNKKIKLPLYDGSDNHVFHVFPVCVNHRDDFIQYLKSFGIQTLIHYPIPPHKQKALKKFLSLKLPITESIHKTIVSLPISPMMSKSQVFRVIETINTY